MTPFDRLPAALALEVDALCDDFERRWRRARRRGTAPPDVEAFVGRAPEPARAALREWLARLAAELADGVAVPDLPGLRLEEEVGRGGMGVVYRGRRLADDRAIAVKLIRGAEHAGGAAWLAELADLRHPHLLPLEGFGIHAGVHFVVMPFVAGGDLKERRGEFGDARSVAGLMARVADAVDYLHRRGILHRDLKPSNILLDESRPLVCDFGLAGRLGLPGAGGTPPYMAPEQRDGRPLTAAADVWGLGAVLHELLTGRPPDGPELAIVGALEDICRRCLRLDPDQRYATAADLAADLRASLEQA